MHSELRDTRTMIECIVLNTSNVLPFNDLDHTVVKKYAIFIVRTVIACNYTRIKFVISAGNQRVSLVFSYFIRQVWFTMSCNHSGTKRFNVIMQWDGIDGNVKCSHFLHLAIGDISDSAFFTIRIQFLARLPWCNDIVVPHPFCVKWRWLTFRVCVHFKDSNSLNYFFTKFSRTVD